MAFIDGLDDDETFSILSHPIRRRILNEMFVNDGISFSTMSQDWGIATGTIYHHIAKLSTIIYQNESNEYILNDKGISLCEWFLKEKQGKATIKKIDTFTILTYPLVKRINENVNIILLFLPVAFLVSFYLSSLLDIISLGPFLFPATDLFELNYIFIVNLVTIGIMISLYCLTIYVFDRSASSIDKTVIAGYLLSLFPNVLLVGILYALNFSSDISFSLAEWVLMSSIGQLFFLMVNGSVYIIMMMVILLT
jgi:hypothetical protein